MPPLRTHSVPPTYHLPLKLPYVSQVFLQQLANLHVIQAGWVWDGGGTVSLYSWTFLEGRKVRLVVEVLGIGILHLNKLQCGRRRMTFTGMSGSGQSRNNILCKSETHWTLFLCDHGVKNSNISMSQQVLVLVGNCQGRSVDVTARRRVLTGNYLGATMK